MAHSAVSNYMTPLYQSVSPNMPVLDAMELMDSISVSHIGVEDEGRLVGTLTTGNILHAASLGEATERRVQEIMIPHVYLVTPSKSVLEVIENMADHRHPCGFVLEDDRVMGVFSIENALAVMADHLAGGAHGNSASSAA